MECTLACSATTRSDHPYAPSSRRYVLCSSCKSPDTLLDRDASTRIMFMRCQQCGASRTVSAIKSGFQARTVSRKSQLKG